MRQRNPGHILVDMMERIVVMQDTASENVPLAPFIEMDMRKIGYASIHVSLGERSWPPAAGYSFVCWFQHRNFLKSNSKDVESSNTVFSKRNTSTTAPQVLRLFSVAATDGGDTFYAEILVHSKPNALAGLFQASVAYVYLNGKFRHTGRLGYSLSPAGKSLQVKLMEERNMKPLDSNLAALSARCSKDLELNLAESFLSEMGQCTTAYPYNQLLGACDTLDEPERGI
ncbi:unnamed protein product [Lactuca virosa]|uniref:Uncharacterized protein n=1 Tax=Lactuca virosa TaxID=75947 RepID=A0AAU9LGU1_9ASTR|nr:unnamed protein product [Lactuca virosa]